MANGKRKINLNKKAFSFFKGLIVYFLIALAALMFFYQVSGGPTTSGSEVPISQIVSDVKEGKIQKISLEGDKITAEVKNSDQKLISRKEAGESIYKILESSGVDPQFVTIEVKDLSIQQAWIGILSAVLPILILVGLMFLLFRNAKEAGQGIFSFAQSRARLFTKDAPQIKFTDVAGADEAKQELSEIVEFLKTPEKFKALGARIPKGVLMVGPAGTGKCITGDTIIWTNKGLMEIREVPRYYFVDSKSHQVFGAGLSSFQVDNVVSQDQFASHWFDLGKQKTIKIQSSQGFLLEGTPEHPVVVMGVDGKLKFRRLDQIEIDDHIAIQYGREVFGNLGMVDPDTAYLLGLLTGDGNLSHAGRVGLTSIEDEIIEFYKKYLKTHYPKGVISTSINGQSFTISNWDFKRYLYQMGMSYLLSFDKLIPSTILQAPQGIQTAFLQGLFDIDASVEKKRAVFEYTTVSERMARQVQMMLLNLGVVASLNIKGRKENGYYRSVYRINLTGSALVSFGRSVGFRLSRKQNLLHAHIRKMGRVNTNIDIIPSIAHIVEESWRFISHKKLSNEKLSKTIDKVRRRGRVSRETLKEYVGYANSLEIAVPHLEYLRSLLEANLFFSKVVEKTDGQAKVYDFTVPQTHNFLGNGFINHNTLISRAIAGEAGVPFYSIAGSEFMEMLVGVGASVTGDTPILIKDKNGIRLISIKDFADRFYTGNEHNIVKKVEGTQTLGFDKEQNGFQGTKGGQLVFKSSAWKDVEAVYRHKVLEIYGIEYLGGKLQTTGDHSVFVRDRGRIIPKKASELKSGDLLVELPSNDKYWLQSKHPDQFKRAIIKKITKKKYDGFVYDLCGVENEAFFGGQKPVLLHNSRVRDMFAQAKKNSPSIIFIDEIESIGRQRGIGIAGGHDEREQTLNQILVEMDGFTPNERVIILAATNRPDLLDAALIRPGRFDRRVMLSLPDLEERKAIIELHMKGKPFTKDVSTEKLARRTVGFSGADLANMLNEAAILAARAGKTAIDNKDLEEAATKEKLGPQRKRMQSEHDRKLAAYHEAGHAIVGHFLPNVDPVHRISIVSRGMSGGHTLFPPTEDRSNESKSRLVEHITAALGGQAAEELVFKDISTGAASDIEVATNIARSMVTQYGMSTLGPLSVSPRPMFGIWRVGDEGEGMSSKLHDAVDAEIKKIMDSCYKNAQSILSKHKIKLDKVAKVLLEKETLESDEFEGIVGKKRSF